MKAVLKEMYSLEINESLENYIPEEIDNFELIVCIAIGEVSGDGADIFEITVCSSKWLQGQCTYGGAIWGRGLLIMSEYNYSILLNKIQKIIDHLSGDNWHDLARQMSQYARWEFENYH